jgi:hypothetical protein
MPHPLVLQLRFARSEFQRALVGLEHEEARRCLPPMNCISWSIGHLAWQEQRYWLGRDSGELPLPQINVLYASGAPSSAPPLDDIWVAWHTIIQAADPWLDTLTTETLQEPAMQVGNPPFDLYFGNLLQRTIYHYWYHTGENSAIRQMLGHTNLPQFVGNIDEEASYRPEPAETT